MVGGGSGTHDEVRVYKVDSLWHVGVKVGVVCPGGWLSLERLRAVEGARPGGNRRHAEREREECEGRTPRTRDSQDRNQVTCLQFKTLESSACAWRSRP